MCLLWLYLGNEPKKHIIMKTLLLSVVVFFVLLKMYGYVARLFKKSYNSLEEFFTIDIRNAKSYNARIMEEDEERNLCRYSVDLQQFPQMGVLDSLEIVEHDGGSCNLIFRGKAEMTSAIIDFIGYCFEHYGADQFGKGRYDISGEFKDFKYGTFSRTWKDVNIYTEDGWLYIVLFGISQNKD